MGNNPWVFISDIDIARNTFRKNDFAGRPESYFGEHATNIHTLFSILKLIVLIYQGNFLSNDRYQDVVFTGYGHKWEALRRVTHTAVQ